MSYFNKRTSTGIFKPSGNGFKEYKGETGNGSVNDVTKWLGYNPDQVYCTFDSDPKKQINFIVFEIFTRNIVCISTNTNVTYLTEKDIKRYLANFSVTKEFTTLRISDDLTTGIENGSLPIDFLARILQLNNSSRNGMFYSERIKTYLYFTEGLLTDFHIDDGLFPAAKHVQEVNKTVFNWISEIAYKYWPQDSFQAKKEINIQCEAWSTIPNAFGNEYIPLHRTENGGANLHMIKVCHYGHPITIEQFKEINHGRYSLINHNQQTRRVDFVCGNFKYQFDMDSGDLISSELFKI